MKGGAMERPDLARLQAMSEPWGREMLDYIELLEDAVREAITFRGLVLTTWGIDRPLYEALARLPVIPPKAVEK